MAIFITFEGGEGCGKSYQSKLLNRRLQKAGITSRLFIEPGSTSLGKRISRLLKWGRDTDISPLSEVLLFNAARSQLVSQEIKPALNRGEVVICDRFYDSTTAYQSYGRGLDIDLVNSLNSQAAQGLVPDLTILLDMPPETGFTRTSGRRRDRFENEALAFHRRVRDGFRKLSETEPKRWLVIDATLGKPEIAAIIRQRIEKLLAGEDKSAR
jgi:dTMP kinase